MATAGTDPTLTLPPSEQVPPGSSIAISGISYDDSKAASNPGAMFMSIRVSSGTLSATDNEGAVSGSGSNALTLTGSYADVTAALGSLIYGAGPNAGSDTISFDLWDQYGIETTGTIPATVQSGGGGGSGPTLTEPPGETVAAGATQAVGGSYSDSFAKGNPGSLFLGITDSSGTLSARQRGRRFRHQPDRPEHQLCRSERGAEEPRLHRRRQWRAIRPSDRLAARPAPAVRRRAPLVPRRPASRSTSPRRR